MLYSVNLTFHVLENILLCNAEDFSTLKIADFGLGARFAVSRIEEILTLQCGTLAFMAPELSRKVHYTNAVDIWSCGIIMYMLLTGKHPIHKANMRTEDYIQKLANPTWDLSHPNFTE